MPIIPFQEEVILKVYYCPICRQYYKANENSMSCCVNHPPGDCCHYGDIELNDKEVEKYKEKPLRKKRAKE